jgi:hypothetical protein
MTLCERHDFWTLHGVLYALNPKCIPSVIIEIGLITDEAAPGIWRETVQVVLFSPAL